MSSLSFLLSERQFRILRTVLLEPFRTFSLTDLAQAAGPGHGSTQRYVQKLLDSNMLLVDPNTRQRRYQANVAHPIYPDLRSICLKASQPGLGVNSASVK